MCDAYLCFPPPVYHGVQNKYFLAFCLLGMGFWRYGVFLIPKLLLSAWLSECVR